MMMTSIPSDLKTFSTHSMRIQHVNFPTHIQGHTLDIITTFGDNPEIKGVKSNEYSISHHFLVDVNAAKKYHTEMSKLST